MLFNYSMTTVFPTIASPSANDTQVVTIDWRPICGRFFFVGDVGSLRDWEFGNGMRKQPAIEGSGQANPNRLTATHCCNE